MNEIEPSSAFAGEGGTLEMLIDPKSGHREGCDEGSTGGVR